MSSKVDGILGLGYKASQALVSCLMSMIKVSDRAAAETGKDVGTRQKAGNDVRSHNDDNMKV